jgi:hypothetical protein
MGTPCEPDYNDGMADADLQALCERGQSQLMEMAYLQAEASLERAEELAWVARDFDTLARLYMPLQEARRQRRQRCGEGAVRMDLIARGPQDEPDAERIVEDIPHGQLLVAGWGSIAPAVQIRQLQKERGLYLETYLAAAYPITGGSRAVVIVPLADVALPPAQEGPIDALLPKLPPHCIVLHESELPRASPRGTYETYAWTMALWERLHLPYLAAADMQADPIQKIEHYRRTIRVDYACELAHQKLSDVAKRLAREMRARAART